ncbi:hypothetical protein PINS_up010236 [Pythium insidiosum]|nr:hypothetical protein PINS_up010236 [Pythium insidiosum]
MAATNHRSSRLRVLSSLEVAVVPIGDSLVAPKALARRRQTWLTASLTVLDILANAVCCSLIAWGVAWLSAIGNPFSRQSPAQQSYRTFAMATYVSNQLFYCAIGTGIQAAMLRALHFCDDPAARPATLLRCVWRIMRRALPFYLVSLALIVSVAYILSDARLRHLRSYRLDVYLGWTTCFVYTVGLGLAGRFVFKNETLEGQRTRRRHVHQAGSTPTAAAVVVQTTCRASLWDGWQRVVVVRAPILAVGLGTVLYVHVLSAQTFETEPKMIALIVGSIALKHVMQHVAKRVMLTSDVKSIRTMVIAVGPPTVLIDTQLRVILQRVNDTHITLRGAALMALLELSMRLAKARGTRRVLLLQTQRSSRIRPEPPPSASSSSLQSDQQLYIARLLAFRAAALVADMSAEYIAMGCASAILFFCWHHDKYRLGEALGASSDSHSDASTTAAWDTSQTLVFLAQAGVEIVVDVFSCGVEIAHGVTFGVVRQERVYVALVFIATAIGSIIVTATTFLRRVD